MTLDRLDGSGSLSLSDFEGKAVVVNFWASWCVPSCRDEHPHLVSAQERYGEAVQFIGVSCSRTRRRRRCGSSTNWAGGKGTSTSSIPVLAPRWSSVCSVSRRRSS